MYKINSIKAKNEKIKEVRENVDIQLMTYLKQQKARR